MNEGHVWVSSTHLWSINMKKIRSFYSFSPLIIQLINVKVLLNFNFESQ